MDEVPWLSPDERRAWLSFVLAATSLLDALDQQLQRDAGITRSHLSILQVVAMAPERAVRMSDVAATLRYSPSRLSHAVSRLERDGWVERRPDPADGRGQLVALTDEGQRRIDAVAPRHVVEVRARVFDHLSTEQVGQLEAISDALLRGMAAGDEPD